MNLFCHAEMKNEPLWTCNEIVGILGPADILDGIDCYYVAKNDSLTWFIEWDDAEKRERIISWHAS